MKLRLNAIKIYMILISNGGETAIKKLKCFDYRAMGTILRIQKPDVVQKAVACNQLFSC